MAGGGGGGGGAGGGAGKGGGVRDEALRAGAATSVQEAAAALGWRAVGRADSRLAGPRGTLEIFLWLVPQVIDQK